MSSGAPIIDYFLIWKVISFVLMSSEARSAHLWSTLPKSRVEDYLKSNFLNVKDADDTYRSFMRSDSSLHPLKDSNGWCVAPVTEALKSGEESRQEALEKRIMLLEKRMEKAGKDGTRNQDTSLVANDDTMMVLSDLQTGVLNVTETRAGGGGVEQSGLEDDVCIHSSPNHEIPSLLSQLQEDVLMPMEVKEKHRIHDPEVVKEARMAKEDALSLRQLVKDEYEEISAMNPGPAQKMALQAHEINVIKADAKRKEALALRRFLLMHEDIEKGADLEGGGLDNEAEEPMKQHKDAQTSRIWRLRQLQGEVKRRREGLMTELSIGRSVPSRKEEALPQEDCAASRKEDAVVQVQGKASSSSSSSSSSSWSVVNPTEKRKAEDQENLWFQSSSSFGVLSHERKALPSNPPSQSPQSNTMKDKVRARVMALKRASNTNRSQNSSLILETNAHAPGSNNTSGGWVCDTLLKKSEWDGADKRWASFQKALERSKISNDMTSIKVEEETKTFEEETRSSRSIEDERRSDAALIAGIPESNLPSAELLASTVRCFFAQLASNGVERITAAKMVVVCRLYDERIPVAAIDEVLLAVDPDQLGLHEDSLYIWTCLMFGDCKEQEFLNGVKALGEAAESVRGMDFAVGNFNAFT